MLKHVDAGITFEELYDEYFFRVNRYLRYRVPNTWDADDLTAGVFMKALENFHRYRGDGPIAGWLFRIAHNIYVDYVRAKREYVDEEKIKDLVGHAGSPEEQMLFGEEIEHLRQMLAALPPDHRDVVALRYAGELRFGQIAQVLGKSEAAVRMMHKSLTFPQVGYWSMRQAVAYSVVNNLGQLSYRLSLTDGRITGEIKNSTGLNLRDCRLVLGGTAVNLGSLPVGSSKTVDSTLARQGPFPTLDSMVNQLLPASVAPGQPDAYVRERQMLEQPVNRSNNLPGGLPVYFIGWSDSSTGTFKLAEAGTEARDYGLMLVRQPLALTFTTGQAVKLPPGLLCGDMNLAGNGQGESTSKGWLLGKGKATLQFDLANLLENHNFQITQIQLPARRGSAGQVMRVFDWRANHWDEVPVAGLVIAGADLERYMDKNHVFKYQIERVGSAAANQQPLPDIGVEGVIEP